MIGIVIGIAILCFYLMTITKPKVKILLQYERKYEEKKVWVTDIKSNKDVRITLPKYVRIKKFKLLQISKEICGIEIETYSNIPTKIKDNIRFSVYFSNSLHGSGDFGITCGIGPSPYNSPAPSRFGHLQGGVFSFYSPFPGKHSKWIDSLTYAKTEKNKIIFHFKRKHILNKVVRFVIITYKPHLYEVYWKCPKMRLRGILAGGIDFEVPENEEILHMTRALAVPEP